MLLLIYQAQGTCSQSLLYSVVLFYIVFILLIRRQITSPRLYDGIQCKCFLYVLYVVQRQIFRLVLYRIIPYKSKILIPPHSLRHIHGGSILLLVSEDNIRHHSLFSTYSYHQPNTLTGLTVLSLIWRYAYSLYKAACCALLSLFSLCSIYYFYMFY